MESTQRGRTNLVSILLLMALIVGGYAGYRGIPIYVEKMNINRLLKQAANQWVNVTPNLNEVKRDLQANLETSQVKRVTADDVTFSRVSDDEVYVNLQYSVIIKHPIEQLKPTKLKFNISHRSKRSLEIPP